LKEVNVDEEPEEDEGMFSSGGETNNVQFYDNQVN
jgi:hypothetical protein